MGVIFACAGHKCVFYHYCGVSFTIINVPEVGDGKLSIVWQWSVVLPVRVDVAKFTK